MKISIVTTMYHSSSFLEEFTRRVRESVQKLTDDHELILVNDGSPDNSLQLSLAIQENYPEIKVVDLSRNFGHHAAIMAGLEAAKGDYVFLIDCDLEEQPEWLSFFYNEMLESDCDVVFGVQEQRIQSLISNFCGSLFWKAINVMSSVKIPHDPMTIRLMTKDYVDALLTVEDRVLYLAGAFAWAGFKQKSVPLTKQVRRANQKSSYNLSRKLIQVIDSFSSFSVAPLAIIFFLGMVICLLTIIYSCYLFASKVFCPEQIISGYTSLMLSVWLLSGIIIASLGVIGLYLSKIFSEVKRRPLFIIKKIYE